MHVSNFIIFIAATSALPAPSSTGVSTDQKLFARRDGKATARKEAKKNGTYKEWKAQNAAAE